MEGRGVCNATRLGATRYRFKLIQPAQRMLRIITAHDRFRLQASADCGPAGIAKDCAPVVGRKLYATHAGGLPIGHAGNG